MTDNIYIIIGQLLYCMCFLKYMSDYYTVVYCRFLPKNNIFTEKQYGFTPKCSAFMALLNLVDEISAEIENNRFAAGIFGMYLKAFDAQPQYFVG